MLIKKGNFASRIVVWNFGCLTNLSCIIWECMKIVTGSSNPARWISLEDSYPFFAAFLPQRFLLPLIFTHFWQRFAAPVGKRENRSFMETSPFPLASDPSTKHRLWQKLWIYFYQAEFLRKIIFRASHRCTVPLEMEQSPAHKLVALIWSNLRKQFSAIRSEHIYSDYLTKNNMTISHKMLLFYWSFEYKPSSVLLNIAVTSLNACTTWKYNQTVSINPNY